MARKNNPYTSAFDDMLTRYYKTSYYHPPTAPSQSPPKFKLNDQITDGGHRLLVASVDVDYSPYSSGVRYDLIDIDTGKRMTNISEHRLINYSALASKAAKSTKATKTIKETTKEKPKVTVDFDSVVIAEEKRQQILEALEQINQNDLIFTKWGFGETIEKGKGVSLLFWGPPGTGKTLMAQAIANKLGKKLKVISTADIESSAPGEAERNIRKHFKEAKDKNDSVLLFDECDSLIYSREGVGAILGAQINELLSQLERFDGITIFTTNRLGTLDEAVNRRLALKLEFEMPSEDERIKIWQRMFPEKAPLAPNIDWRKLAMIEITGGYIKNVVLRAARMAASEKLPDETKNIRMEHLVKALKFETESMISFEHAREKHTAPQGKVDMHRSRGSGLTKGGL